MHFIQKTFQNLSILLGKSLCYRCGLLGIPDSNKKKKKLRKAAYHMQFSQYHLLVTKQGASFSWPSNFNFSFKIRFLFHTWSVTVSPFLENLRLSSVHCLLSMDCQPPQGTSHLCLCDWLLLILCPLLQYFLNLLANFSQTCWRNADLKRFCIPSNFYKNW